MKHSNKYYHYNKLSSLTRAKQMDSIKKSNPDRSGLRKPKNPSGKKWERKLAPCSLSHANLIGQDFYLQMYQWIVWFSTFIANKLTSTDLKFDSVIIMLIK